MPDIEITQTQTNPEVTDEPGPSLSRLDAAAEAAYILEALRR
jgi:hypothetical protein